MTCGEIISSARHIAEERLYDDELRDMLSRIEVELKDGIQVANMIRSRLFQVRRRFSEGLADLLDEYFFSHSEAREPFGALKREDIKDVLKAAYDLRSRYVHTGVHFGMWVRPLLPYRTEIMIGTPVLDDTDLKKLLIKAPTFCGLERIMRYALLKIAQEAGAIVADLYESKET